ncbi:MAG: hypothetical protein JNK64_19475, partial [Myxococcales bacterium]|nr:hypothetical protein [Myxococcales bacterium]
MTTDRDLASDELSTEERALLDRWLAPLPPADFAARPPVAPPRRARRRWPWIAGALA